MEVVDSFGSGSIPDGDHDYYQAKAEVPGDLTVVVNNAGDSTTYNSPGVLAGEGFVVEVAGATASDNAKLAPRPEHWCRSM